MRWFESSHPRNSLAESKGRGLTAAQAQSAEAEVVTQGVPGARKRGGEGAADLDSAMRWFESSHPRSSLAESKGRGLTAAQAQSAEAEVERTKATW